MDDAEAMSATAHVPCDECAEHFGIDNAQRHRQHHSLFDRLLQSIDDDPRRIERMWRWLDASAQAHEDRQAIKRVLGRMGLKPVWFVRAALVGMLLGGLWLVYGDWHKAVKALIGLLGG
jgi:hypothetical protein